jgi:tetratricopeptide (TPR) repeat protein
MNRTYDRAAPRIASASDHRASEQLQAGLKHHRAGNLAEAEACYRSVLAVQPRHAPALHLLGLTAHALGRPAAAAELIRQALRQDPRNATYFSDLGAALKDEGKREEAAAACREAIRINPAQAVAYCNLGAVLRDQGKADEAVAACRQAIRIRPDSAESYCNLGVLLYDQGKLDEAITAFSQAIRAAPNIALVHFNLGEALRRHGKLDEAVSAYRRTIEIRQDYAQAHSNLGIALCALGKIKQAEAAYRRAIQIRPDNADDHASLGRVLYDQNRSEEAVAAFRRALVLNPSSAETHNSLGLALRAIGQLPQARAALEEAVRLAPRNTRHRRNLSEIGRFAAGDPHLAALEQLAREAHALPVDERIELHFALGKAYEDVGRHPDAFRQWLAGNALKRAQISYDEAAAVELFDRARKIFSLDFIRDRQNAGHPSPRPVFIIGMARSGTTLVEQILASHPRVFGAGELTSFRNAVNEVVCRMDETDFHGLGARYLAETERLAAGATHVTDKMPGNFLFAGLIHLALPNARIIHTVRDPLDTCLSCFSKLFAGEQNYTYDLGELGRYYRYYQSLMAHWDRVLPPGRIHEVRYEDVVADLEAQARRILLHCGLDWDPHCLSFHETTRAVHTASAVQVRQPIYGNSIGRWRVHAPFLTPLIAELRPPEGPK